MSSRLASRGIPSRPRLIGHLSSAEAGPMLVAVGSMHGNEPAGVAALARVLERLSDEGLLERGDVVGLIGNLSACDAELRFIDEDLNRRFSRDRIARLKRETAESVEDAEQKALLESLELAFASARGPIVLLDLHTTSGPGAPFAVFADTLRSRNFARGFPVPVILGLEEQLEGTLVDFVGLEGHVAVGFEGGQHDDPEAIDHLTAILWMALERLELVNAKRCPWVAQQRRAMAENTRELPSVLQVTYRHAIRDEDDFRMLSGFRSFQRVTSGQTMGRDVRGDVSAPQAGYLLMPLYQKQGDDGFFVVERVLALWLHLSSVLRHMRAGRLAHWLPGVSRIDDGWHALAVDRRVARWYALELLHLLGFRRRSEEGAVLIMERRHRDLA